MKVNFAITDQKKYKNEKKKKMVGKDHGAHIGSTPNGAIDPESLTSHDGRFEPERNPCLDNSLLF